MLAYDITTLSGLLEHVMRKTARDGACLLYTGTTDAQGRGIVHIPVKVRHLLPPQSKSTNWFAPRLVYWLHHGAIQHFICHTCDRPGCVEITHLFEGTHLENMYDMYIKRRNSKGEHHSATHRHSSGLYERDVEFIRSWYVNGRAPYGTGTRLARYFGISESFLTQIAKGDRWVERGIAYETSQEPEVNPGQSEKVPIQLTLQFS